MDSQLLLNGMLPPSEKFKSAIKDNYEIEKVHEMFWRKVADECLEQRENYNIEAGLATLAPIIIRYSQQGRDLPFLIKQVLFCVTVNCLKYQRQDKWTQVGYWHS